MATSTKSSKRSTSRASDARDAATREQRAPETAESSTPGVGRVANVLDDGDLVRRGVTIRRSIEDVRRAWSSAAIDGDAEFNEAPGDLGTEVRVTAPGNRQSALEEIVGAWKSDDPGESLSTQLREFKALLETGEVATTKGQPSCRESTD